MTGRWGPTRAADLMVGTRLLGRDGAVAKVTGITCRGDHARLILDGRGVASMTMHEAAEVWAILPEETGT